MYKGINAYDAFIEGAKEGFQTAILIVPYLVAMLMANGVFRASGARAMMIDTMKAHGADSFAGRLAAIVQGSTETTFYVLAIYFGAVGIKRIRHAAVCGIIADFSGIFAAIVVGYWFFG